jgi:CheY-like chemotaxis protein
LILVVDDNAGNQYSTKAVLDRLGYLALVVQNGEQALEAYAADEFDLILMDCRMPVMDGYEATSAIRQLEEFTGRHIPIIGITAYALEGDREKCLAVGMDDYITKPLSLDAFKAMLMRWLPHKPPKAASL